VNNCTYFTIPVIRAPVTLSCAVCGNLLVTGFQIRFVRSLARLALCHVLLCSAGCKHPSLCPPCTLNFLISIKHTKKSKYVNKVRCPLSTDDRFSCQSFMTNRPLFAAGESWEVSRLFISNPGSRPALNVKCDREFAKRLVYNWFREVDAVDRRVWSPLCPPFVRPFLNKREWKLRGREMLFGWEENDTVVFD
jgi:hypothetical protein